MFPGLFIGKKKKGRHKFKVLMLPILLRPDTGTHDCLVQSDMMEKKADTSLFPVNTFQELVEWAWVCVCIGFKAMRLRVSCILTATRSSRMESEGISVESETNSVRQRIGSCRSGLGVRESN